VCFVQRDVGCKRDRDLGRKSESGASKRKIKAELQRNNLELSGSLLKILKRNDDASVSNKDLGESESGEPVKDLHESGGSVLEKQFSKSLEL
jgi:hypothetical protein